MVVYQSGSVAGVVALLGTLKDFAVARGATNNNYSADGAGQRHHMKLGSGFFNFKALVNESIPSGASGLYGITAYGSTGYNGGAVWNDQPGGPKYSTNQFPFAGIHGLGNTGTPSPTLNYHLFYVDRPNQPKVLNVTGATNASPIVITANRHRLATGDRVVIASVGGNTAANGTWTITRIDADTFSLDGSTGNGAYTSGGTITLLSEVIYLVVEYTSGYFQHLMFGQLDRSESGEVAGAWFVTGQHKSSENNNRHQTVNFFGFTPPILGGFVPRPDGMVYATVDGITGWKISRDDGNRFPVNGNQFAGDGVRKFCDIVNCAPNAINSQSVGLPIPVFVTRDGTNQHNNATPWTILGYMPEIYYCNIRNLVPASQYPIGSTQYRVFPFFRKSDGAYSQVGDHTQHLGFFIRES